jgi:predicted transcriptional regulator
MIPIAYKNYLQFKKMLELLSNDELSISDIQEKVGLPQSTAYKKMKDLQRVGVIELKKYRLVHGMRREALYRKVVEQ